MNGADLFWALSVPVAFIGALLVGAVVVEHVIPRWSRRLRALRQGRERQAREWQDHLDAERRKAAAWIAANCCWHQDEVTKR